MDDDEVILNQLNIDQFGMQMKGGQKQGQQMQLDSGKQYNQLDNHVQNGTRIEDKINGNLIADNNMAALEHINGIGLDHYDYSYPQYQHLNQTDGQLDQPDPDFNQDPYQHQLQNGYQQQNEQIQGQEEEQNQLMKDLELNDSEDEGIDDYKLNGYHPVHIGEILLQRYIVIQKLGWGHFSTVWLCKDNKYNTYVAIKVQKSGTNYMESAFDEVEILQNVGRNSVHKDWIQVLQNYKKDKVKLDNKDDTHVIQLLNCFLHKSYYGDHFCMVFEILGVNLLEIIKRYDYKGVDLNIIKIMTKQLLIGLDFLGRHCNIIHTDLKPENVLLCLSGDEIRQIGEQGSLEVNQRMKYQQKMLQKIAKEKQAAQNEDINIQSQSQIMDSKSQIIENKSQIIENKSQIMENKSQIIENKSQIVGMSKKEKKKQKRKDIKKKKKQKKQEQKQQIEQRKKKNELHLDESVSIKIGDLGNACWSHHHFATQIQTRQYRAIETLLGIKYNANTDIWSLMCMIYELLTGDFLFQPQGGQEYSKNEDHIAQILELLLQDNMDQQTLDFLQTGTKSRRYLDCKGNMKRIKDLQFVKIEELLIRKYRFKQQIAKECAEFLRLGLKLDINQRYSAQQLLEHDWLQIKEHDYDIKMSDEEYEEYVKNDTLQQKNNRLESYLADDEAETNDIESDCQEVYKSDQQCYQEWRKICDRSFTDLGHIGYYEGIKLEQLDTTGNTQFQLATRK